MDWCPGVKFTTTTDGTFKCQPQFRMGSIAGDFVRNLEVTCSEKGPIRFFANNLDLTRFFEELGVKQKGRTLSFGNHTIPVFGAYTMLKFQNMDSKDCTFTITGELLEIYTDPNSMYEFEYSSGNAIRVRYGLLGLRKCP